jgi:hypothetical protein
METWDLRSRRQLSLKSGILSAKTVCWLLHEAKGTLRGLDPRKSQSVWCFQSVTWLSMSEDNMGKLFVYTVFPYSCLGGFVKKGLILWTTKPPSAWHDAICTSDTALNLRGVIWFQSHSQQSLVWPPGGNSIRNFSHCLEMKGREPVYQVPGQWLLSTIVYHLSCLAHLQLVT